MFSLLYYNKKKEDRLLRRIEPLSCSIIFNEGNYGI